MGIDFSYTNNDVSQMHICLFFFLTLHVVIFTLATSPNGFLSKVEVLFSSYLLYGSVSVMAFFVALCHTSFSCLPHFSQTLRTKHVHLNHFPLIRAVQAGEADSQKSEGSSTNAQSSSSAPKPKKPVYSMKKGQIVRVDKEKYLNSINYLSVGHPPYYKGLDYIYEDRGEILDMRIFETGEYALIAWVGIPTAPAWLPTDMLIKSEKLNYERL